MDSYFCRNCERVTTTLIENTYNNRKNPPYRVVYVQLSCGDGKILATEQLGEVEDVSDEYSIFCNPYACSNIISVDFLSSQMLDDYNDAINRAFGKIDAHGENELPEDCLYKFEHEFSDMNRSMKI